MLLRTAPAAPDFHPPRFMHDAAKPGVTWTFLTKDTIKIKTTKCYQVDCQIR